MSTVYLPYAVTEVFLIIYAATILLKLNINLGSEYEVRELKNIIYAYFVVLVTDIFWALVEDNIIEPSSILNAAVNGISISAVAAGCYFWYKFVEYRLRPKFIVKRRLGAVLDGLIIIVIAFNLISIFTGWVFYIDAYDHYDYGPLFFVQAIGSYVYLLIPTVNSIARAVRTHSRLQRREYLLYAAYMFPPLLAGLLEDLIPTVPVLCLSMFMIIHILFLTIQDMQIYSDALTGLNNRRRLNQFLEERLAAASKAHPVGIFIMDINKFKAINDTYGHVEGDAALKMTARALKMTAAEFNAFVARYGGDEFCLVIDGAIYEPTQVAGRLRGYLEQAQAEETPPKAYAVSISIGYTVCDTPEYDIDHLIGRVDKHLYEDKTKWHRLNAQ